MIPVPQVKNDLYDIFTEYSESKIVYEFEDGGKGFMKHKRIEVLFKHKRTDDTMLFRITGKDKYYQNGKDIPEREAISEFNRLLGAEQGDLALKVARMRLIIGC